MKKILATATFVAAVAFASEPVNVRVKIDSGMLEGATTADSSVRIFRSVPFAAPPVGNLRWRAPQPVAAWSGVRKATEFAAHCVQGKVFGDIAPRGAEMSEDCLSLTVWTPAHASVERLPVYVWFYGGGFAAGAEDEPRYDGESFAKQGIVVVNANYRLGIFGFFAHPDLTKESGHNASGNYGLLDQVAAIEWVRKNIKAFGGDPENITIGGESAGSLSVSALMASPVSRDLFQRAIGESGAFLGKTGGRNMMTLAEAEKEGVDFTASAGAKSLSDLRAMPAADLLATASKKSNGFGFWPIVDGYFLPADAVSIYAQGKQAHVPLLAGWNADEMRMAVTMARTKPTAKSFADQLHKQFGARGDDAEKVYAAADDEAAVMAAGDLASDQFIVYGTWKWIEEQAATGVPVYRYEFDRPVPAPEAMKGMGVKTLGSPHAAELEYVFTMLDSKKADWQPDDYKVAKTMNDYWANFIKTGNPNGASLPKWPDFTKTHQVMHLNTESRAEPEQHRDRYVFLDSAPVETATH
jgi:para-nitrobenzyl esterase